MKTINLNHSSEQELNMKGRDVRSRIFDTCIRHVGEPTSDRMH